MGAIFAMAQTPDGYLWLGSEFGLFRFDGLHAVPWQPPAGQQLPNKPYALLVTLDGTLWIGTFEGLVSWSGGKLTYYPEIGKAFVTSLLEDRDGTVWVGTFSSTGLTGTGCARYEPGSVQCKGEDGAFGSFVWSLGEDSLQVLSGPAPTLELWRWNSGPAQRYAIPGMRVGDLLKADDGRAVDWNQRCIRTQAVIGCRQARTYPIYSAMNRNGSLRSARLIRTSCCGTVMGVSGLEPTNGGFPYT